MKKHIVKICGLNYDLKIKRFVKEKADRTYPDIPLGRAWPERTQIEINAVCSSERQLEVLIHESLHNILYDTGGVDLIKDDCEEGLVLALSAPLTAFIRDNIKLLRQLGKF